MKDRDPRKTKKESFSDWRNDLSNLIEVAPMTDVEMEKEVKEKSKRASKRASKSRKGCRGRKKRGDEGRN